jgi:hypothetical protein
MSTSLSFVSKAVAVVCLASLSVMANAEAIALYKDVPGVVKKVDTVEKTITITTRDGATRTFKVVNRTKIATTEGIAMPLDSLKGYSVVVKKRVVNPVASETKAQVLSAK